MIAVDNAAKLCWVGWRGIPYRGVAAHWTMPPLPVPRSSVVCDVRLRGMTTRDDTLSRNGQSEAELASQLLLQCVNVTWRKRRISWRKNTASSYFLVGVRVRVRVIFRKSFLILKRVKNGHVRNVTSETHTRETATRTVTEIVASNIRHMFKNFFKKKTFPDRPTLIFRDYVTGNATFILLGLSW